MTLVLEPEDKPFDALAYGMVPVASVSIDGALFKVDVTDQQTAALSGCVYAFVVGGIAVRIGSSKGVLRGRLAAWQRDVSKNLAGITSSTRDPEGIGWRARLPPGVVGTVFARQGTIVTTPVGTFPAYLNEECALIERYKPKLNWSWR